MDVHPPSCTEQLWSMTPAFDAPWLHDRIRDDSGGRHVKEVESKNIELNRELGVFLLQMHIAREDLERARREREELQASVDSGTREVRELLAELKDKARQLQDMRVELALLRSERVEQEQIAVEIWGPANRRQPDATWDTPPALLFSRDRSPGPLLSRDRSPAPLSKRAGSDLLDKPHDPLLDKPLSVCKVAADLGFKHGAPQVNHLGTHVRKAFMRAYGRAPEPRIFFARDGTPDRVGCFTERDREFLAAIVRRHGEPDVD